MSKESLPDYPLPDEWTGPPVFSEDGHSSITTSKHSDGALILLALKHKEGPLKSSIVEYKKGYKHKSILVRDDFELYSYGLKHKFRKPTPEELEKLIDIFRTEFPNHPLFNEVENHVLETLGNEAQERLETISRIMQNKGINIHPPDEI